MSTIFLIVFCALLIAVKGEPVLVILKLVGAIETPIQPIHQVVLGEQARFSCKVQDLAGQEHYVDDVEWTSKDNLKTIGTNSSILDFNPVKLEDQGIYYCKSPLYNLIRTLQLIVKSDMAVNRQTRTQLNYGNTHKFDIDALLYPKVPDSIGDIWDITDKKNKEPVKFDWETHYPKAPDSVGDIWDIVNNKNKEPVKIDFGAVFPKAPDHNEDIWGTANKKNKDPVKFDFDIPYLKAPDHIGDIWSTTNERNNEPGISLTDSINKIYEDLQSQIKPSIKKNSFYDNWGSHTDQIDTASSKKNNDPFGSTSDSHNTFKDSWPSKVDQIGSASNNDYNSWQNYPDNNLNTYSNWEYDDYKNRYKDTVSKETPKNGKSKYNILYFFAVMGGFVLIGIMIYCATHKYLRNDLRRETPVQPVCVHAMCARQRAQDSSVGCVLETLGSTRGMGIRVEDGGTTILTSLVIGSNNDTTDIGFRRNQLDVPPSYDNSTRNSMYSSDDQPSAPMLGGSELPPPSYDEALGNREPSAPIMNNRSHL